MGQEITYCATCQTQLRSSDFEKGRAHRIDGAVYCKNCAPTVTDEAQPSERPSTPPPAPSTRRGRIAPEGSGAGLFVGVGVAVVLVLGLVAVSTSGEKAAAPRADRPAAGPLVVDVPAPLPPPKPVEVPPTPAVPPVRKSDAARESLQKARDFAKAHPADWAGQLALYDQAAWDARETEFHDSARGEREAVVKRRREAFAAQAKAIEDSIRPRVEREEFGAALAAWKDARSAQPSPEWTAMVDKNAADVRARAESLLASLKGKGTPAVELRRRVASWGLPDLEKTLADVPPPSVEPPRPVAPPEPDPLQKLWLAAMDLASARDYAGAIKELERARQEATSPAHKSEITGDLELLRALAAAVDDVGKTLAKLPKGQKIGLTFTNDEGKTQRIDGVVVRAEPGRLVVKSGDETMPVPLAELTAATLAEQIQARGGARAAAVLCCLEGEKPPAEALPGKYAALAAVAAQRLADPREAEARRVSAAAEGETSVPSTVASGAEKLALLLKDFGDTLYVRRNAPQIKARLEAAKETVFHPEMLQASGTFRPARSAKSGPCWTSDADGGPADRSAVELEFAPIPSLEYRCWVYVGACCAETFEFFYQATDLAGPDTPVKHSISTAARKHSAHNGPKQPARWGWAVLPLPRYAQPGLKKVRVLTEQQGFSVAFAVVSATRGTAPTDADLKEWERQRAAVVPRTPADPSLVAYYTFDAGAGATVTDLTRNGNHGQLRPGAAWALGKWGKSLEFDGVSGHVRIPSSSSFDTIRKQVTLSAWIYRRSNLPGWKGVVTRQQGASWDDQWSMSINKDDLHLSVGPGKMIGVPGLQVFQWTHVATTFDGTTFRAYVNGALANSHRLPAPWEMLVEPKPVTIGAGFNDSTDNVNEHFHGLIDEVRIYNRVLTAAEIAALARP